jgi:hypothetical protein
MLPALVVLPSLLPGTLLPALLIGPLAALLLATLLIAILLHREISLMLEALIDAA